jgi:hypothetical protein
MRPLFRIPLHQRAARSVRRFIRALLAFLLATRADFS